MFVWNADGAVIHSFQSDDRPVNAVDFSADGDSLLAASDDGFLRVFSLGGANLNALTATDRNLFYNARAARPSFVIVSNAELAEASFSGDGRTIQARHSDGAIRLWPARGWQRARIQHNDTDFWTAAFAPSGDAIATGHSDFAARMWSLDGELLSTLQSRSESSNIIDGTSRWVLRPGNGVTSLVFSPDGRSLATVSRRGQVVLWPTDGRDVDARRLELSDEDGVERLHHTNELRFTPDSTNAIALMVRHNRVARTWPVTIDRFQYHRLTLTERWEHVYNRGDADLLQSSALNVSLTRIVDATLSANGSRLAILQEGSAGAIVFATDNGRQVSQLSRADLADHRRLLLSGDGRLVLSWDDLGEQVSVFDTASGRRLSLLSELDHIESVEFNRQGTQLIVACGDGTAHIYDARSGERVAVLAGHRSRIAHASFSEDGSRVVTAGHDSIARIWSTEGRLLAILVGHRQELLMASHSPDGRHLVTVGWDKTAVIWDLGPLFRSFRELTADACRRALKGDAQTFTTVEMGDPLLQSEWREGRSVCI